MLEGYHTVTSWTWQIDMQCTNLRKISSEMWARWPCWSIMLVSLRVDISWSVQMNSWLRPWKSTPSRTSGWVLEYSWIYLMGPYNAGPNLTSAPLMPALITPVSKCSEYKKVFISAFNGNILQKLVKRKGYKKRSSWSDQLCRILMKRLSLICSRYIPPPPPPG